MILCVGKVVLNEVRDPRYLGATNTSKSIHFCQVKENQEFRGGENTNKNKDQII